MVSTRARYLRSQEALYLAIPSQTGVWLAGWQVGYQCSLLESVWLPWSGSIQFLTGLRGRCNLTDAQKIAGRKLDCSTSYDYGYGYGLAKTAGYLLRPSWLAS